MGGKRKKPVIPKVYKPTTQLVGEDEGVVWVAKRAKQTVAPEAATTQKPRLKPKLLDLM